MKDNRSTLIESTNSLNSGLKLGLQTESQIPLHSPEEQYQRSQDALFSFHLETGILPSIKVLDYEIRKTSELAVAGGAYSDIWLGEWLGNQTVSPLHPALASFYIHLL